MASFTYCNDKPVVVAWVSGIAGNIANGSNIQSLQSWRDGDTVDRGSPRKPEPLNAILKRFPKVAVGGRLRDTCVVDGDTFRADGTKIPIADIDRRIRQPRRPAGPNAPSSTSQVEISHCHHT